MSAAFYAISFKATASVLAFCSLEKQSPPDQAAWDKLRDGLVGDALPVGFSVQGLLKVPASRLAVDVISGSPPSDVLTNPYTYQIGSVETDTVVPGDGTEKVLKPATGNSVATGGIAVDSTKRVVTVQLNVAPPDPTVPAWLLFEALEPIGATSIVDKTVTFQLPTTILMAGKADVVLLMKGVTTTYQSVTLAS